MDFTFSIGWLIGGLVIAAAGGAVVFFYKPIADNLANGVSSYTNVKKFGVIAIIIGLLMAANLHTFVLTLLVKFIAGK